MTTITDKTICSLMEHIKVFISNTEIENLKKPSLAKSIRYTILLRYGFFKNRIYQLYRKDICILCDSEYNFISEWYHEIIPLIENYYIVELDGRKSILKNEKRLLDLKYHYIKPTCLKEFCIVGDREFYFLYHFTTGHFVSQPFNNIIYGDDFITGYTDTKIKVYKAKNFTEKETLEDYPCFKQLRKAFGIDFQYPKENPSDYIFKIGTKIKEIDSDKILYCYKDLYNIYNKSTKSFTFSNWFTRFKESFEKNLFVVKDKFGYNIYNSVKNALVYGKTDIIDFIISEEEHHAFIIGAYNNIQVLNYDLSKELSTYVSSQVLSKYSNLHDSEYDAYDALMYQSNL